MGYLKVHSIKDSTKFEGFNEVYCAVDHLEIEEISTEGFHTEYIYIFSHCIN